MLAYLSRYTHRVAISNTRLIAHDERGVTFRYKDYRADGLARRKIMTLAADEFIRRFLLHILPKGFHRIRHYGLFAYRPRRQYRAAARVAWLHAAARGEGRKSQPSRTGRDRLAALSLLRRAHDRHRDLRKRNAAPVPAPSLRFIRIDTS